MWYTLKKCQLRHAVLADSSSSIKITVWGELVDQISEDVTIKIISVKLDFYNELRLLKPQSTSTIYRQKQKVGVAHFLIQLKLINIFYVLTRTAARI